LAGHGSQGEKKVEEVVCGGHRPDSPPLHVLLLASRGGQGGNAFDGDGSHVDRRLQ
jgi:hypothetical protein